MALTKTEAAKMSNDMLLRGVIQTIVKESQILNYLPFMEVTGTAIRYTREATNPAATYYVPGDTWAEATPTYTSHTAELKILGGDADVDNFLQKTYADTNDLEAEVITGRAKAIAHQFCSSFIVGDSGINPKEFDGIRVLCPGGNTQNAGANGAALTLPMLDTLVDLTPGRPEVLMMSKRTRRKLKDLRRTSGTTLETTVNQFGEQIETYDGIPVVVDDFMPDNETLGSSGAVCSSIYALKFGISNGLMGIEHGGIAIQPVGELETKDATRTRLKWYTGLILGNTLGIARLQGVL